MMHDPVGAYERVRRVYRLYIESAFPLRSDTLTYERGELLRQLGAAGQSGTLAQPPLVETVPVYPRTQMTLAQASQNLPPAYCDLQYLAQGLFRPLTGSTNTSGRAWRPSCCAAGMSS
jgi:hypothetical protein